jgi:hypothetical protein
MRIHDIINAIKASRLRVTDHADEEAAADRITLEDILFSVLQGEIIEDYPTDRPYPSCLIFGSAPSGAAIHSVWAYNVESGWAVLITVYRPDPERWRNWRERKTPR